MSDENKLITDALQGDSRAFEQLVFLYQDRLLNTLVHALHSREEAEDVAQETFVQAYTKLSLFQGRSAFYTWLYRIAFNVAATRSRRRREVISLDVSREKQGETVIDNTEAPEQQLLRQERAALLQQGLGKLPEEFRTILVLREFEDKDYATISEILELAPGTVRSRLHRARILLKEILQTLFEESADSSRGLATES